MLGTVPFDRANLKQHFMHSILHTCISRILIPYVLPLAVAVTSTAELVATQTMGHLIVILSRRVEKVVDGRNDFMDTSCEEKKGIQVVQ